MKIVNLKTGKKKNFIPFFKTQVYGRQIYAGLFGCVPAGIVVVYNEIVENTYKTWNIFSLVTWCIKIRKFFKED